ncbi:DUF221-domain-containing protein [Pleomassaria siparia CBS 279.74]|uniref:DUF221-domain-containing protein n=1 Tax=Pleomassaria siparia CBS 279.74 TaxID=1314801 RepID=A0A6G1KAJ7_9PLEO|nr:DUF221-domain-containing protein [Pleomassaria siparia CBS 279.74]
MDTQRILSAGAEVVTKVVNETFDAWKEKPKPRGSGSLVSVLSAFVPTWFTALFFVLAFVGIRHRYPKIYAPRTYIGTIEEKDRTPSASRSYFAWLHTMHVVPDKFILYHQSLDAYLYLRFLRTIIFICIVGCCITWPVLMPINATGGGTSTQLDRISIGNVSNKNYLYVHAFVAWIFFTFVMFTVLRERLWLIGLRQAWNLSKPNANRLSSRTVLFLSAPKAALDDQNMQTLFGDDAVRMWPVTKAEKLEALVADRNSKVEQLEAAEVSLIQSANQKGRKGKYNGNRRNGSGTTYDSLPDNAKKSLRPTHRLKTTTKDAGKKVDSIDWLRDQIKEKEIEIEKARDSNATAGSSNSAAAIFVEFTSQTAAQSAYQQVTSSELLALHPRFTGVMPGDVIWENLTIPSARRVSQEGLAHALIVALIIFWSIPVGLVGAWSNVSYLAENVTWLEWIKKLPDPILGLLTGLLPPLLTSLLAKYVPNIYRYIFQTFGEPTKTSAELKVLKWFYVFQVTQVFLVTTVFSGGAAVFAKIASDPTQVPALLAQNLPSSSNYYLTYFIVQGLTSSSDNLLNYSDLLQYLFFDYFFDKTPRQKYNSHVSLKGIAWGKVFPKYTNFAIIAIAYSCIAPLVMGFAAAGLAMFYYSYRYMLLFTVQSKIDTKGQCYTLALQQILTGVYLAELCLIGLFGLRSATGPAVILVILLAVTIIFNIATNRYLAPLEEFIPADLAASTSDEGTHLLSSLEAGTSQDRDQESSLHRMGTQAHVPPKVLDPLARFFSPHIYASHKAMTAWLQDGDFDEDDVPEYQEKDVKRAYLNPAYTSSTPLVWLPKDEMGVSKQEIGECGENGLKASDEGAWVDEKGTVKWSVDDFEQVPIFKQGPKW